MHIHAIGAMRTANSSGGSNCKGGANSGGNDSNSNGSSDGNSSIIDSIRVELCPAVGDGGLMPVLAAQAHRLRRLSLGHLSMSTVTAQSLTALADALGGKSSATSAAKAGEGERAYLCELSLGPLSAAAAPEALVARLFSLFGAANGAPVQPRLESLCLDCTGAAPTAPPNAAAAAGATVGSLVTDQTLRHEADTVKNHHKNSEYF